jgi:hypothetical protein
MMRGSARVLAILLLVLPFAAHAAAKKTREAVPTFARAEAVLKWIN